LATGLCCAAASAVKMAHTLDHIAAERQQATATVSGGGLFGGLATLGGYEWLSPEELEAHVPGQEWRQYGASGEPVFPQLEPYRTIEVSETGMYGYEQAYTGPGAVVVPAGYAALTGTLGAGYGWSMGTGRDTPVVDLENGNGLMLEDPPEGAIPAGLEYLSNVPGEIGEAGGEFLANLFAPVTGIPGDILGDLPIWVPLLGAAFLLKD